MEAEVLGTAASRRKNLSPLQDWREHSGLSRSELSAHVYAHPRNVSLVRFGSDILAALEAGLQNPDSASMAQHGSVAGFLIWFEREQPDLWARQRLWYAAQKTRPAGTPRPATNTPGGPQ